jgi:TonB family protein
MPWNRGLAGVLSICATLSVAQVTEPPQKLPVVKSGDMPFYPPLANMARIQGDIHLRVTTDGSGVASVVVESGQPMLARAAQDNVRTWKFEPHEPTSFSTLFAYQLLAEPNCKTDKSGNGEVRLKLPTQVEIATNARGACYDPNDELDLSEPLRVFLTGCEVDGSTVPCERLTIRLYSGNRVATPTRFKEAKREGFVVPQEFPTMKKFSVRFETASVGFTVVNEDIGFLKGKWHVGIDHPPFKEETPIYDAPATLRCAGFIVYEWGEPGVTASAPCK